MVGLESVIGLVFHEIWLNYLFICMSFIDVQLITLNMKNVL